MSNDNIYNQDILVVADKFDFHFDLVLVIDVLEHFNKSYGELLLQKMLEKNKGIWYPHIKKLVVKKFV